MALLLAPYNDSMRLGQGFNSYTQTACIDQAVEVRQDNVTTVRSNTPSQIVSYSSRFVEKLGDIVDTMNISYGSSIKKGTVEISGNASSINEDKIKSSDLNAVVSVKVVNQTTVLVDDCKFKPIAGIMAGSPQFNDVYGDCYISGFIEGGDFTGIVSMRVLDRSNTSTVTKTIKSSLSGGTGSKVMVLDSMNFESSDSLASTLQDTETTVSVSWMGGGQVKEPTRKWEMSSMMDAASAFPAQVAQCPQRTWAILTKYKANRSFVEYSQKTGFTPLEYDNISSLTAELFENYMEYKQLLKKVQNIISNRDSYEVIPETHNAITTDVPTLVAVRSALRQEMNKIVEAVDVLSKDPGILKRHKEFDSGPTNLLVKNIIQEARYGSAPMSSLPKAAPTASFPSTAAIMAAQSSASTGPALKVTPAAFDSNPTPQVSGSEGQSDQETMTSQPPVEPAPSSGVDSTGQTQGTTETTPNPETVAPQSTDLTSTAPDSTLAAPNSEAQSLANLPVTAPDSTSQYSGQPAVNSQSQDSAASQYTGAPSTAPSGFTPAPAATSSGFVGSSNTQTKNSAYQSQPQRSASFDFNSLIAPEVWDNLLPRPKPGVDVESAALTTAPPVPLTLGFPPPTAGDIVTTTAPPPTGSLNILAADFATLNVSSAMRRLVGNDNTLSLNTDTLSTTFSDPIPTMPKCYSLIYQYSNGPMMLLASTEHRGTIKVEPNMAPHVVDKVAQMPRRASSPFYIVAIVYGPAQVTSPSVYDKLYAANDKKEPFVVSDSFFEIDTWPTFSKTCAIYYQTEIDGPLSILAAKQNQKAQFGVGAIDVPPPVKIPPKTVKVLGASFGGVDVTSQVSRLVAADQTTVTLDADHPRNGLPDGVPGYPKAYSVVYQYTDYPKMLFTAMQISDVFKISVDVQSPLVSPTEKQPRRPNAPMTILAVVWGAKEIVNSQVSDKLYNAFQANSSFEASTTFFQSDPTPGSPKSFTVFYTTQDNGPVITLTGQENSSYQFGVGKVDVKPVVLGAAWAQGDITGAVKRWVSNDSIQLNTGWPGNGLPDTWPGVLKPYSVLYQFPKMPEMLLVTEQASGTLNIPRDPASLGDKVSTTSSTRRRSGAPVCIHAIVWGPKQITSGNVYDRVYNAFINKKAIKLDNPFFEADTAVGRAKAAVIFFDYNEGGPVQMVSGKGRTALLLGPNIGFTLHGATYCGINVKERYFDKIADDLSLTVTTNAPSPSTMLEMPGIADPWPGTVKDLVVLFKFTTQPEQVLILSDGQGSFRIDENCRSPRLFKTSLTPKKPNSKVYIHAVLFGPGHITEPKVYEKLYEWANTGATFTVDWQFFGDTAPGRGKALTIFYDLIDSGDVKTISAKEGSQLKFDLNV